MNKFKLKVFDFLRKTFKLNDLSQIENEKPKSQILKNISVLNSEYPFYELLENVDLISVFLDLKGKVVYCNSYMSTLTGYEQEELIGSDWFGLMVPEAVPEIKEVYLEGLKTGKIANHFENPILTKTGKQHLIFWNNTLLKDPSGTIIGTASIGEDITQRKFFEKALIIHESGIRYHHNYIYYIVRKWGFKQKVPRKVHVNTATREEKEIFKKRPARFLWISAVTNRKTLP